MYIKIYASRYITCIHTHICIYVYVCKKNRETLQYLQPGRKHLEGW